MKQNRLVKWLAFLLAVTMVLSMATTAFAANVDDTLGTESTAPAGMVQNAVSTQAEDEEELTDYSVFLTALKQLEKYAEDYAVANASENANALVINYIRTGVVRYTTGTWQQMAGAENTAFTAYVTQKDTENGTQVSALRRIGYMSLPNGNMVDLGHVFGTMDISYYAQTHGMSADVVEARTDMGGWAGDTADLMYCAMFADVEDRVDMTQTDLEDLSAAIRKRYLGTEYSSLNGVLHSFSSTDVYGDLDAFHILSEMMEGRSISSVFESYFTSILTDKDRADFFLTNRLNGVKSKTAIRKAVLESYTSNTLIEALEASYGLADLDNHDLLQKACCYAFADYLFALAGDDSGETPVDPTQPTQPTEPSDEYYTVFSSQNSTLAPGVEQSINYALTTDDRQMVYYTAIVDINRNDINVYANYNNNDASYWAMARVTDQMAAAQKKHSNPEDTENYIENYNVVVGVNADFYNMSNGQPSGALFMGGKEYHGGNGNFFAILKDGTAMIGNGADYAAHKSEIQEAVGGSVYLVKDGKAQKPSGDYYTGRQSRTAVGITADGKVVLMVMDGRQEPFSAGSTAYEMGLMLVEAGCVTALHLDGGGSATYDAKLEGTDEVTVVNRPSDGYERSVSSSLMVVSTAKSTSEFDHAIVSTATDYLTAGSSLELSASGVSSSGNAAEIPEGTQWAVNDDTVGTISDGVFTAKKNGTVEVQMLLEGRIVGRKTLNVVEPDKLQFTVKTQDMIYGQAGVLPVAASYNGNPVTISPSDVTFELSNQSAGTVEGFNFTGTPDTGIRNVKVTMMLNSDYSIFATMTISLYKEDEAKFDFDKAMCGDRKLAWNRQVSNATEISRTEDGVTTYVYRIDKTGKPMTTAYTFGLDMQKIEVPEQLVPLLKMVAGGDLEDVTAWDILLQLAERVSTKTTVQVKVNFDPNVDVDYSQVKVVNNYFTLSRATMDAETNTLTLDITWIKQSEAIQAETANPVVIVSGISLTPKDNAAWDGNQRLTIRNSGSISYDIYLGANALFSMASQTSFQQKYGIYPYVEPENLAHPNGGHFMNNFRSFVDSYTLDKTPKEGWQEENGVIRYYMDGQILTGIQKLPGYGEETQEFYYDLGTNGEYRGKLTGMFRQDGKLFYAIAGQLKKGWRLISEAGAEGCYYFDYATGAAANGTSSIGGHTYVFENYILVKGAWEKDEKGIHYFWAGKEKQNEWFEADGKEYFAYANTCAVATGIAKTLNHERTREEYYYFDETGAWQSQFSGMVTLGEKTYLVDKGVRVNYPGLFEMDGALYYINSAYVLIKNQEYYLSKTNGLKPAGKYWFDADGKLMDSSSVKNGIVKESDIWYYYVNGEKTYAGLIQIDGYYYYVRSNFQVVHGQSYFVSKTNGLMASGTYEFDAEGRMVIHTPEEKKNGIVKEGDIWYYYDNDAKTYAGLIQIDGYYYYVRSNFQVVHGQSYFVSKTNGLMASGTYEFDAEGRMVIHTPEEKKNGIVKEGDIWYYYDNDAKTYAGLIQIDGYYYYVRSNFQVVHGRSYFVSKTNGLMPNGTYEFDSEGRMVLG